MADHAADPAVVEQIAEQFLEQHRQGKKPSVDEFCDRYPEHADELRGFLPALVAVEVLKPNSIEGSGPTPGPTEIGGKQLDRLGDYRILGEVGRGGMGVVYEAEQESLGRRVALKVLAQHLLNEARQVKRFLREARAAAKLHHTNIVPVFGVGEQNGHHYYVMQFIQGLGLDEVLDELRKMDGKGDLPAIGSGEHVLSAVDIARSILKERRNAEADDSHDELADSMEMQTVVESDTTTSTSVVMPGQSGQSELSEVHESEATYWDGVARIGIQVAEALEHAHEQGTLHRDIKPSNLLLDGHGQVWVTDFGLAKVAEADDLTHTGDILGTIRYMAPERFHGQCDARTDIYSLGITLYELLARRPAYLDPAREQLIRRIEAEPPTPLRKTTPGIPRDLETIVNKAIEKDPAHRYKTAQDLADDLQRFVDDEPIHARRISIRERFVRWSRRNPVVAGSVSVATVALIAIAVVSALFARSQKEFAQSEAESADKLRNTVADRDEAITDLETALDRLEAAQSELKIESARLALEKGHGLMDQQDAQTALTWYARALSQVEGNTDAVHLDQFIRRGISASQSHLFALGQFVTPQVNSFEVSPDGRFVVTRTQTGGAAPDGTDGAAGGRGFPGGGFQGGGRGNAPQMFTLWDTQTGRELRSTERTGGGNGINFSPDSRFLLIGGRPLQGLLQGLGRGGTPALLYDLTALNAEPQEIELPRWLNVVGISRGGTTVFGIRERSPRESPEPELRPYHFDIASETEIPFTHAVSLRAPQSQNPDTRARPGRPVVLASASETRLVTSVAGAELQIWRLDDTAAAPEMIQGESDVSFVKLTPDERHVLVGYIQSGPSSFARRLGRAEMVHCLPLDDAGEGWTEEITTGGGICDFTPDGGRLLLIETEDATRQQRLTVRSTTTGRLLQSMALPRVVGSATGGRTSGFTLRPAALELRCHPDGRSVLLSTIEGVRQFEIPSWSLISATVPEPAQVTDFGFYKDGTAVYAFSEEHVRLHDLTNGMTETIPGSLQFGRISNDGGRLVGTHEYANDRSRTPRVTLRIMDLAGGTAVQEHRLPNLREGRGGGATRPGRPGTVPDSLSADRRHFMTAVPADDPVEPEADPDNGRQPRRRPAAAFNVHDSLTGNIVTTLESRQQVGPWCVSPSTAWMAQHTRVNQVLPVVVLTDLRSGESFRLNRGRGGTIGGLYFSNDEHWLVCASGTQFAVFDLRDEEFGRILFDTSAQILDVALLPDNRTVLVLETSSVVSAWDIESGHSFSMTLNCVDPATEFAISPDGTRLATQHRQTSKSKIRVWEMPLPIEGTQEQIKADLARRTGISLDERGVRELSIEELPTESGSPQEAAQDVQWHHARAIDEIDQQSWEPAQWHLARWTELEPDNPLPHAWMAYCELENNQLDECLKSLDVVRDLTREPEASHTALVPLLLEVEIVSKVPNAECLKHLEHQLQLDPESLTSILQKSWIEANMRRWDDAIRDREYAVERLTNNHSIQLELAAYYLAAGEHEAALAAHLERMLDLWENTTEREPKAAAALAALIGSQDSGIHERAYAAADRAVRGDRGNFQNPAEIADSLIRRFDKDDDGELSAAEVDSAPILTNLLGIEPDSDKNLTRDDLAAAFERRMAGRAGNGFTPRQSTDSDVLLAKGIADYRREEWDAAYESLTQAHDALLASRDSSVESDDRAEPVENSRIALTGLFLAMTEQQRGNAEAAGEQMAGAQAILEAHVDDPTSYDANLEWWIFAREALKEAEGTLGRSGTTRTTGTPTGFNNTFAFVQIREIRGTVQSSKARPSFDRGRASRFQFWRQRRPQPHHTLHPPKVKCGGLAPTPRNETNLEHPPPDIPHPWTLNPQHSTPEGFSRPHRPDRNRASVCVHAGSHGT